MAFTESHGFSENIQNPFGIVGPIPNIVIGPIRESRFGIQETHGLLSLYQIFTRSFGSSHILSPALH
jgi:hypothetical protein